LTSLESGADDFERRMIENLRNERRNDAPTPKVHAFSKARVRPRVGVTLENLERHNAKSSVALGPSAHVKFQSPPSSSGSTGSDPALNVPSGWGRKGRVRRNWLREITTHDNREPGAHDDTSIEDSPLSHKGSLHGTPASQRRRSIEDWSFDMNEASLIASTPYRPRNTRLEDIRQRELESLQEQGVATNLLDRIRESSPEEIRRPRSASTKSATAPDNATEPVQTTPEQPLSEMRLHKRNKSWQAVGKAPAITGEGTEGSPIVVYKRSSETIGMVDSRFLADTANARRPAARRDDSRDLLRRLARASSTPSPGRPEVSRPQTTPTRQTGSSSQTMVTETSPRVPTMEGSSGTIPAEKVEHTDPAKDQPRIGTHQPQSTEKRQESRAGQLSANDSQRNSINATPKPANHSIFNPKTPVVTGAWVDTIIGTPGPSTVQKPSERSQSSTSPQKGSPRKSLPQDSESAPPAEDQQPIPEVSKPTLPRSVLGALVEEARASGQRRPTDYGDSTINSLEELMAPIADTSESGEPDEDTIPLDVSTKAPRNEAERRRQEELVHIQNMDRRLRSTRTSLRDTSRGIRRVEEQIERDGERTTIVTDGNENEKRIYREYKCPCVETGGHHFSLWKASKLLFYDERLKPSRRGWGLTWLSIFLLAFLTWFILENICCEIWGHHPYASSYKGYGVVWGAPEYPYVLPTMTYRAFIKPWWRPLHAGLSWI
ncbi:hypothetical protein P171DRAFT_315896, partial [Karstenula rhodostoma CBS 690.94]